MHSHPLFLILLGLMWIALPWKKILTAVFILTAAWAHVHFFYAAINLDRPISGTGHFKVSNLKVHQSPFQRSYLYSGTLSEFHNLPELPCQIFIPQHQNRPLANKDYVISGRLIQKAPRRFILKPEKQKEWTPIKNTFHFAEWRFQAKQSVQKYLDKHLKDKKVSNFIHALVTGEMEERELFLEFGRLGLQHILAISGFHFGLLAAFCAFFLRLFLPPRITAALSLILLSGYFFFVGTSPSVGRAWIAILIFLLGKLFNLRCSGLNALGVALSLELAIHPLVIEHLGFQLSFLCAFAILLLYPRVNFFLEKLLPSRPKSVLLEMDTLNQHGYLFSTAIRNALALNLSVHLFALPVVLFSFHQFPWLSLIYNLFIPFLASATLFILFISLPLPFLHPLNNAFTSAWLHMVSNPPARLDRFLYIPSFSFSLLMFLLVALTAVGIYLSRRNANDKT